MLDRAAALIPATRFIPDSTPDFGADPTPYVVLLVLGFVVGVFGHLIRSRATVAAGIAMIFLATFLLPLVANVLRS